MNKLNFRPHKLIFVATLAALAAIIAVMAIWLLWGAQHEASASTLTLAQGKALSAGAGNSANNRAASAQSPTVAEGTGFTYQGSLKDGGNPANGSYDFQFSLYDALSGGSLITTPITLTNQTVSGGLFTVTLDYGSSAFDGNARYLDIQVCQSGGGGYTPLSPRQPITPAPYALFALKTQGYKNVVVVAKSGGDYTTITDALNSITNASATNHYLVYVAPGVYTENVMMKQYVDIEGAGEKSTKITFTGSADGNTGTVVGANNAELRFLTVQNTGGNNDAIAIFNFAASPSLLHVTANASSGVINDWGVFNDNSSPSMTNVTASASGGSNNNYGVEDFISSPTMVDVTASASGPGGSFSYGIRNGSSSPTMVDVTASASGGLNAYGVYNVVSSPSMINVTASASGGSNNYGVEDILGGTVSISNSKITGSTNTIFNDTETTTRVGASQLSGGNVSNSGTLTCAGVYDENYVFFPSTCP